MKTHISTADLRPGFTFQLLEIGRNDAHHFVSYANQLIDKKFVVVEVNDNDYFICYLLGTTEFFLEGHEFYFIDVDIEVLTTEALETINDKHFY